MNQTGTYVLEPGQGLVRVSNAVPHLQPHVWTPKGDLPYYDKSAHVRFESKAHKRTWLAKHGMQEAGIIRKKDWSPMTGARNARKPSLETRRAQAISEAWVQQQGGTMGLLNKIERARHTGKGNYV